MHVELLFQNCFFTFLDVKIYFMLFEETILLFVLDYRTIEGCSVHIAFILHIQTFIGNIFAMKQQKVQNGSFCSGSVLSDISNISIRYLGQLVSIHV